MNPIELLIKGSVIALLALAANMILRKQSAAHRHLILILATVTLLLLPIGLLLPQHWDVSVSDQAAKSVEVVHSSPAADLAHPSSIATQPVNEPNAIMPMEDKPSIDWLAVVSAVWILSTVLLLTRQGIGLVKAGSLVARAHSERSCGGVLVRISDTIATPALVGWRKPVLLLPPSSRDWSQTRIDAVMAHELAHLRRRDWIWMQLGLTMQAIHALNPLAWLLVSRIRSESELACDDVVLSRGVDAAIYAQQLVDIARQAKFGVFIPTSVVGMASGSGLKTRILSIADSRRSRKPVRRWALLAGSLLATIVGFPLIAGRLVAQTKVDPATTDPFPIAGIAIADDQPVWKGSREVTVKDSGGHPVANADVAVGFMTSYSFDFGNGSHLLKTNSEGVCKFSNRDLDPQHARGNPVLVVVHADGFGVTTGPIDPNRPIVLPKARTVRLRFVDPSGQTISGVRVRAATLLSGHGQINIPRLWQHSNRLAGQSGPDGSVTLTDLPSGPLLSIETVHPNYVNLRPQPMEGLGNVLKSGRYHVADQTKSYDVALTPASTISGRVAKDGKGQGGIQVVATMVGWSGGIPTTTDSTGKYLFTGLRPGQYSVKPVDPSNRLVGDIVKGINVGGAQRSSASANIEISLGANFTGVVKYTDGTLPDRRMQFMLAKQGESNPVNWQFVDCEYGQFSAKAPEGDYVLYLANDGLIPAPPKRVTTFSLKDGIDTRLAITLPTPPGAHPAISKTPSFSRNEGRFYGPARLSDGHLAKLAFVQTDGKEIWRPDGSGCSTQDLSRSLDFNDVGNPSRPSRAIYARVDIDEPRDHLDCIVEVPFRSEWSVWQSYGDGKKDLDMATFRAPNFVSSTDMRIGVGHGAAQRTISESMGGPILHARRTGTTAETPNGLSNVISLQIPSRIREKDFWLVAYDRRGKAHEPTVSPGLPVADKDPVEFGFNDLHPADIQRLELKIRDWDWVTFTGIHLYPKS